MVGVTFGKNTVFNIPAAAPGAAAPGAAAPAGSTGGGGFSFGATTTAAATLAATTPAATTTAATPSTPTVGSSPAPPLFGAAPTPAPAPAGGGFSFATPAQAPATSGGLFGASTPAPAPAGGGLFGAATPAPAPTGGGLFGATTPAPAPAGGGLFGASTPAPAPVGGSFFGAAPAPAGATAQVQAPQQAAYQAHLSATHRLEAARLDASLRRIHAGYSSVSSDPLRPAPAATALFGATAAATAAAQPSSLCRFHAVFYDPMTAEQARSATLHGVHHAVPKPPYVEPHEWNDALARNPDPDSYVPAVLVGSEALHSRVAAQQKRAELLGSYASQLRDAVRTLQDSSSRSESALRYGAMERDALRSRMIRVMQRIELVRAAGLPLQRAEREADDKLSALVSSLRRVGGTMRDLEERATMHARRMRLRSEVDGVDGARSDAALLRDVKLGDAERDALAGVLNEQRVGMERLASVVRRDVRDVRILKEEVDKLSGNWNGVPTATVGVPPGPAALGLAGRGGGSIGRAMGAGGAAVHRHR